MRLHARSHFINRQRLQFISCSHGWLNHVFTADLAVWAMPVLLPYQARTDQVPRFLQSCTFPTFAARGLQSHQPYSIVRLEWSLTNRNTSSCAVFSSNLNPCTWHVHAPPGLPQKRIRRHEVKLPWEKTNPAGFCSSSAAPPIRCMTSTTKCWDSASAWYPHSILKEGRRPSSIPIPGKWNSNCQAATAPRTLMMIFRPHGSFKMSWRCNNGYRKSNRLPGHIPPRSRDAVHKFNLPDTYSGRL